MKESFRRAKRLQLLTKEGSRSLNAPTPSVGAFAVQYPPDMARPQVQVGGLMPRLEWRVRPPVESGLLVQALRSRIEGNARVIGGRGSATYGFRVLSGMEVAIRLVVSGAGQVRVRTQAGGLLSRAFRGEGLTLNLSVRVPLSPPVQQLQVTIEALRRRQVRLYELSVVATDRDDDRDGIGDAVERLLGAPAGSLRPLTAPLPSLQLGESSTSVRLSLLRIPVPTDGEYQPEPVAMAYLLYAARAGGAQSDIALLRSAELPNDAPRSLSELQQHTLTSLIASAMFPEATVLQPACLEGAINGAPSDYTTVMLSAARACEAIAQHPNATIDAGVEGIGMLIGEATPSPADEPAHRPVDDLLTLGVALVNAGVPITLHALQRLPERALPRTVRLLLWTPEAAKPTSAAEIRALANWVRAGGWLAIIGGTDRSDARPDTPWQQAGAPSPIHWLMHELNLPIALEAVFAEPTPPEAWRVLGTHGTEPAPGTFNRQWVEVDLSAYAGQTVYVKFSDSLPDTGWGALLRQVRLEADGRVIAAFFTGSPAETLFMHTNHRSRLNAANERYADRDAWFVYRFPLPQTRAITLRLELAQEWQLELSTQPPYREHLIVPTRADLPPISLRDDETITLYRMPNAEVFYAYQGEPVGVVVRVGRGGVALLGVSGRAFGNNYGGARDWRTIVQYLCVQAGLRYRERARIVARRGEWVAAFGTYRATTLRGTYLDALDPHLPIVNDPLLTPRTPRLLLQVDNRLRSAGLLHTNAQLLLRHEPSGQLAYLVRGPAGANGVARFAIRGLRGQVSLTDTLGNPLPVNTEREGATLLVRWNLNPDGQVLIVR